MMLLFYSVYNVILEFCTLWWSRLSMHDAYIYWRMSACENVMHLSRWFTVSKHQTAFSCVLFWEIYLNRNNSLMSKWNPSVNLELKWIIFIIMNLNIKKFFSLENSENEHNFFCKCLPKIWLNLKINQ